MQAQDKPVNRIDLKEGATVEDLVPQLQQIGASARDVISILQAMKEAGALEADLECSEGGEQGFEGTRKLRQMERGMQATLNGDLAVTGQVGKNESALSPRLVHAAYEFEGR